ncbi:hypothetical protein FGIG_11040 [Fasciola gigantica]|uniref:Uncharacterized protein n=1 Tax=Fasciola gigantica TaxID=46835 RepID=A0A504YWG0_FASGI|nr:hypothetical protein FGIG_11040 [Fasciola gigantica]
MAWIPIGWLQNKPLLNCDLVLILSGSASQDNNPFKQVGGLFDRINLPSWSQSNSNQTTATKLIHLGPLSHTDVQKCLDDLCLFPHSTSLGSHVEQMIFSGGLGPLELRLLIALIRQDRSEQALNHLREFSLTNLIQLWFNMAEQDYGRERVQLVVQNLVASRFGINWSDLVQWYTNKQAHVLRRPSQSLVKFAHRHSLTVRNANLWASGQLNKSNLTYSWWKRFSLIYLIPFGLLGCRLTGPHGSGRLTYLNHGTVRNALLMRYGPDVDSSLVPVHRSQAVWYTEQLAMRWCNPIAHGGYTLSTMDWRSLLELPYQLAKSKQYKKLKLKCFYNIHWLREMLSIAYHGHDRYPSVQFLLDEITAQLCTVRSERVELLKAEMQTHPLPPTTLISRLDLFSFVAVQLMEDQPELMQLVGSLCCWRGQLKRDPDLIVPLCYMHFGFTRNADHPRSPVGGKSDKNSDYDDLKAIEVEEDENPSHEDEADNMNLADSDDHFGKDRDGSPRQNWNKSRGSMLVQLLNQIDHKASDLILRPINYTLVAQSITKILISANQTHAKSGEMSVWPKTSMEITALAYCPMNKNLLAIGLWNRQARTTSVEIWNILQDQMEWNQLTSSQTLGPISLIRWLADKALILVQTTRPVLTIWPVEVEQTWTDEFYELRTGSHGSSTGLSSEIPAVYVISTEDNRTCYIAVVYSGKEQIDLWSWDSSKVQYLGHSNTFGHWVHMPVVSALNEGKKARQLSLPVVIRPSSGELLVDMTHEKQYLRFVVAQRGTCTAYLFTAGPVTNPGHMDWSKPRALKCPPESTRIMAVACIHSRGLVTVATRTPRDEHIVGCLNLFDSNSGQLLEQIDGSAETFACTEFNLSSQGLLAYTVPPSLRFVLTDDQMRLFTISRKPIGQPVSSSFELIAWNFSTRVQRRLTDAELFPYLEQQHLTPLPIPADTCDLGSNDLLSVCFNMNAEMGSRLCYSDISVMLTRPIKLLKRRNRPQRLIGRLHQGTVNAREWIIYFCTNEEDEQVYFMSMSWSPLGESTQTYSEKFILPENRKPHATDRFILSDNLLIVLGNLGYSEVVEECSTYLVGPDENRTHFMAWSLKHGQVAWRMKPEWNVDSAEPLEEVTNATGISDTNKTVETSSVAVTQPIEDSREQWTIENFILSGDGSMLVASYGLPYFCVFSLHGRHHVGNLNEAYAQAAEDTASTVHVSNRSHTNPPGIAYNSSISNTALSFYGEWFAQAEFSTHYRTTCLTIWSLHALHNPQMKKPIGLKWRRRRLLDQSGLIALTVNGSDGVVITACLGRGLFVWCPVRSDQVHQLPMSERLDYTTDRPPSLICSRDGTKVAVSSGPRTTQITAWSIPADTTKPLQTSYFLGHAFTPNPVLELNFSFLEDVICARVQDADKPYVLRVNWFNT